MKQHIFPLICAVCTTAQPLAFPQLAGAQSVGDTGLRQVSYQDSDTSADPDSDDADNYDVFYDRLAPDGQWLNDDNYGYVFHPGAASSDSWHPYSDGHWVSTDRGWTWVSNENFGWATYHYGRWIRIAGTGWVWVPGNEWAPAWVSWRQTDDNEYCGWAPLPPEATVSANFGVSSWCDNYYGIGPAAFTFVRFNDFWRPSYRGYSLPQEQNLTIINRTQNITNIAYNNNFITNNGPQFQRVSQISAAQGHPLQTYQINYAAQAQRNAAYKTAVQGNQLNVIAPPQKLNAIAHRQPQAARQLGNPEVQRGWQNVQPAQKQQLQQTFAKQSPVPTSLPPKPGIPPKPQFVAGKPGAQPNPGKPDAVKQGQTQNGPQSNTQIKPAEQKPPTPVSPKPVTQTSKPPVNTAAHEQKVETKRPPAGTEVQKPQAPKTETAHVAPKDKTSGPVVHKAPVNAVHQEARPTPAKHETQVQHHQAPVNHPPAHPAAEHHPAPAHTAPVHAAQPHPPVPNHPAQPHPAQQPRPAQQAQQAHKPASAPHHDNSKDKDKKKE